MLHYRRWQTVQPAMPAMNSPMRREPFIMDWFKATLGNSSLGWEKTTATNIGFESNWLKNRLFVDMNYYFTKTTDQIFVRTIPIMTGFITQLSSLGEVDNKGFELTVRTINIQQKDLSWSSTLTLLEK